MFQISAVYWWNKKQHILIQFFLRIISSSGFKMPFSTCVNFSSCTKTLLIQKKNRQMLYKHEKRDPECVDLMDFTVEMK